MRRRIWLIGGAIIGIAIAAGHLPYLAGAGRSLADTAQRLVDSGANRLIRDAASSGAPRRVVLGLNGVIAALVPGVTALLLVVAARGSLRLRAWIALLIVAVGASSYLYHTSGKASGVLVLALTVAAAAVALTGPLVAAPLAALAGLIAGTFLPTVLRSGRSVTSQGVDALHRAIYARPGTPEGLKVVVLVIALAPFLVAARLILRR